MSFSPAGHSRDRHAWGDMTQHEMLNALVYELYGPVSALGNEIDRLTHGAFEDDELMSLLDQMRENIAHLSTTVVALKRYADERRSAATTETT
jgi:hypothetical protein